MRRITTRHQAASPPGTNTDQQQHCLKNLACSHYLPAVRLVLLPTAPQRHLSTCTQPQPLAFHSQQARLSAPAESILAAAAAAAFAAA
jgi:hypothetical protein